MSKYNLSEGCLSVIMSGGHVDEPTLQVLGNKKIVGNADKERYRLLVSDGKFQISFAMIATQINDLITSGRLTNNSVIKVKKYITSMINNGAKADRRVMVILELDILHPGEDVGFTIGTPAQLSDDPSSAAKTTSSAQSTNGTSTPRVDPPKPKLSPAPTPISHDTSCSSTTLTVPIINLSPYQNKWVIKARVMNKSNIRTWSNSRGEGKLFSIDLADESGEIRATVFRDLVDKFYDMIEIDKIYYISKCQIKTANKKFCNLNNDYEMAFTNDTTVTPCFDEVSVPKATFNFTTIDAISSADVGAIVDVIGICKAIGDVQTIVARSTNKELKKREVTLVDQSNNSVVVTLWGTEAENFNYPDQPVLAIRGARINEFGGGKNVSVLISSVIKVNPDVPEAHRLRGWFDNEGKDKESINISARTGSGNMRTDWLCISDVKQKRLGATDTPEYYQCKATIILINTNNILYKACPSEDCNKKIVDLENYSYRCEKCNKEYDRFKWRMIMSANIGDWSDNQWVSIFAHEAEKIIGMTSQELGDSTENDKDALSTTCSKANFSEFIFRCRAKLETYNDETRLKTVVVRVDPINYKEYNAYLLNQINQAFNL